MFERARQRIASWLRAIASEHSSPARLFFACVVGGIVGSTPFFGLHFFICVGIAWLLRLNRVAVYGAANISIPPLAPFLALGCIEVGSRVLHGHGTLMQASALRGLTLRAVFAMAGDVVLSWLVGAPLVGGAIGAVIGAIVYGVAKTKRQEARDPFSVAAQETARRFAKSPPKIRHYVPWKVRLDPVYRAIAGQLPDRVTLVDLGTGMGILSILVTLLGAHRRASGVEWDEQKARAGVLAAEGLPIEITQGDLRTFVIPPCDVVTLVDVLHYFPIEEQRAVLERAAAAADTILIRESAPDARAGSTRFIERIAVAIGWNKSAAKPHFRPIASIVEDLERLGMTCEVVPVAGPLHPGNVLIRATAAGRANNLFE
ncbi:MAG: DUF2062 domain-containing protein [Polyangiales bacterium]